MFGECVQKSLLGLGMNDVSIYVLGHPNFVTTPSAASARLQCGAARIEEESARLGEVLSELSRQHHAEDHPGFVAIGHSIGAWVVLQHLLQASDAMRDVALAVLAMPFLEFSPSGRQLRLRRLLGIPGSDSLVRTAAYAALLLPKFLQRRLVQLSVGDVVGHTELAEATFCQQPHHLVAQAVLGRSEFWRLDPVATPGAGLGEFKAFLQSGMRPPILALYVDNDMWGPKEHCDTLRGFSEGGETPGGAAAVGERRDEFLDLGAAGGGMQAPGVGVATGDGSSAAPLPQTLEHGFVLWAAQNEAVAAVVAGRVAACFTNVARS